MALALTFSNGKPAPMARGRYSTRNNRVVEIDGYHFVTEKVGGEEIKKRIWDGCIYEANGINIESKATWSNDGRYLHNEGVGSSFDLATVISQEAEPEPEPLAAAIDTTANSAVLENQILCVALCELLKDKKQGDETPVDTLTRVLDERDAHSDQTELLWHIREVLVPELKEGETATAGITRIIEERDTAQRQVASLPEAAKS
jgi:hypothetical protein